jgi:hypothetical protein
VSLQNGLVHAIEYIREHVPGLAAAERAVRAAPQAG